MLPVGLALHRATPLRSLRCADRLAGGTLRRVHRAEAGVRQRPRGGGVRRAGATPRCGVEGARSAAPCEGCRRGGGGNRSASRRPLRDVRAGRSRSPAEARTSRRGAACSRAVRRLGATARAASPPDQRLVASARVVAGRPPSQRCRRIPGRGNLQLQTRPRRRRLHDRLDRGRSRICTAQERCAHGRGRDVRPRGTAQALGTYRSDFACASVRTRPQGGACDFR
jgi:hypothetical protein